MEKGKNTRTKTEDSALVYQIAELQANIVNAEYGSIKRKN
ncbi:unnamed protein product [marine sediment metagenome]|uniref:Uncharacterized protein n=1 Tax=marine sediment metagenome TaxID=412755 RepID=X1S2D1_9ZZZZ